MMTVRNIMAGMAMICLSVATTSAWGQYASSRTYVNDDGNVADAVGSADASYGCDGNMGCDSCCNNRCWRPYMGVEATFLAPILKNDTLEFGVLGFDEEGDFATGAFIENYDDNEKMVVAPRLWIGIAGDNGYGVQFRYWQLRNGGTNASWEVGAFDFELDDVSAIAGESHSFLNMYTIDLEATRDFCHGNWDMVGTFGVRYGSFDMHNSLIGAGAVLLEDDEFLYVGGAASARSFNGTGLTFSVGGDRELCCRSFSLFWNARGSLLWGDSRSASFTSVAGVGPDGGGVAANGAIAKANDELWIAEFQAGIQWSHCIQSFNARFFARAAFEYQWWRADKAFTESISGVGFAEGELEDPTVLSVGEAFAGSRKRDFDLIGFSLSTGFVW